jgi:hypothetical protein
MFGMPGGSEWLVLGCICIVPAAIVLLIILINRSKAPPPPPPPVPSISTASELERLSALHEMGQLTDEEFAAAKAKLLGPDGRA